METVTEQSSVVGQEIELSPIAPASSGELSDNLYLECCFCGKTSGFYPRMRKLCERLSGPDFYCDFCLRHGFNRQSNRNILIVSFRAIVGFYYYDLYRCSTAGVKDLYLSDIEDYVKSHIATGLQNPIFIYDEDTMLWFLDFEKIGRGRKKVRVGEVLRTVVDILSCFDIYLHYPSLNMHCLYDKYREAIEKFYCQRYRPDNRKECVPTFASCGVSDTGKKFSFEDTRIFTKRNLVVKY
jgi:hypothetical protein